MLRHSFERKRMKALLNAHQVFVEMFVRVATSTWEMPKWPVNEKP